MGRQISSQIILESSRRLPSGGNYLRTRTTRGRQDQTLTRYMGQPKSNQNSAVDWATVLGENASWLRKVIAARVPEREAVEDILQEVALAAVKTSGPQDKTKIGPWLYRIAIRQAMLFRRSMGRQKRLVESATEHNVGPAETVDPLDWLLGRERNESIRKAVCSLAARDREILELKHGEAWSYQKIADHLGVTRHTVEYRLIKSRARLRELLVQDRTVEITT